VGRDSVIERAEAITFAPLPPFYYKAPHSCYRHTPFEFSGKKLRKLTCLKLPQEKVKMKHSSKLLGEEDFPPEKVRRF
jgi:hypothetical protein